MPDPGLYLTNASGETTPLLTERRCDPKTLAEALEHGGVPAGLAEQVEAVLDAR